METRKRMACWVLMVFLFVVGAPTACGGLAEAKALHTLPGAFGESIDEQDEASQAHCVACADQALAQMLMDFEGTVVQNQQDGYLQVLQTTVYLIGEQPAGLTPAQASLWSQHYAEAECLVSFVVMDNSANLGDVPCAEVTGLMGDYVVQKDGTVQALSLRRLRNQFFTDPVLAGMRVVNLGSRLNAVYAFPRDDQ